MRTAWAIVALSWRLVVLWRANRLVERERRAGRL